MAAAAAAARGRPRSWPAAAPAAAAAAAPLSGAGGGARPGRRESEAAGKEAREAPAAAAALSAGPGGPQAQRRAGRAAALTMATVSTPACLKSPASAGGSGTEALPSGAGSIEPPGTARCRGQAGGGGGHRFLSARFKEGGSSATKDSPLSRGFPQKAAVT
ncbi:homeobox protein Hox-A13-like [Monodelphis domestica]|uniref:homeobox protein Hox-A13-like n=1 Tax=Monodelphis domestica TaxID=13616 RepID=UPI0007B4119E|nr:homeobox protein Hox-A13-like [Monodelphis domestica]